MFDCEPLPVLLKGMYLPRFMHTLPSLLPISYNSPPYFLITPINMSIFLIVQQYRSTPSSLHVGTGLIASDPLLRSVKWYVLTPISWTRTNFQFILITPTNMSILLKLKPYRSRHSLYNILTGFMANNYFVFRKGMYCPQF